MKIVPFAAVLAVLWLSPPAAAQDQDQDEAPHAASEIITSGNGEASLTPDRAILRVGMETRASSAADASAKNAEKVKAVVDKLRGLGYQADSLRTVGFSVTPNYDYSEGQKLVDYQATAIIKLTVNKLENLGSTIDAVLAAGATNVSNIEFESDDRQSGRASALSRALSAARSDATAIAEAAGGRLGRLLEVTTQPGMHFPMAGDAVMMRASNVALPPQDVLVSVMVQARWEFVPGR
jgi:uncharacterized protein YggE